MFNLFNKKHNWQLVGKTYAPPSVAKEGMTAETLEKVLFGVTTLLWECTITGDTRKEELLGSDESQLTLLCEKADKFGMQYVTVNGKSYAIALVPPEDIQVK